MFENIRIKIFKICIIWDTFTLCPISRKRWNLNISISTIQGALSLQKQNLMKYNKHIL